MFATSHQKQQDEQCGLAFTETSPHAFNACNDTVRSIHSFRSASSHLVVPGQYHLEMPTESRTRPQDVKTYQARLSLVTYRLSLMSRAALKVNFACCSLSAIATSFSHHVSRQVVMLVVRKTRKSVDKPLPLRDKQKNTFVPQQGSNIQQQQLEEEFPEDVVCLASSPDRCFSLTCPRRSAQLYIVYFK